MGEKMSNAPVYFTVVQVRFNPILNLENYLPDIQGQMRVARFPDFKRETIQQLVMQLASPAEGGQSPAPSFAPKARCVFGNIDRTAGFILEHNALSLQTVAYDTSDTFFADFLKGMEIVHSILQLDFIERIGLRYFDAVIPESERDLSDYLVPEVLGLSHKLDGELGHSFTETVTMNSSDQLVSRVIVQDGLVGLPPEIAPLAPQINSKFTETEGRHAIIDTDAFCPRRDAFSLEGINLKLSDLHMEIEKSFKLTVTNFALEEWK
ncbi:MAG: TIGR04255 family protein [Desulfuromusa sp.]|nr:TIGR04255 family protein [Desulfuromusa sp.]